MNVFTLFAHDRSPKLQRLGAANPTAHPGTSYCHERQFSRLRFLALRIHNSPSILCQDSPASCVCGLRWHCSCSKSPFLVPLSARGNRGSLLACRVPWSVEPPRNTECPAITLEDCTVMNTPRITGPTFNVSFVVTSSSEMDRSFCCPVWVIPLLWGGNGQPGLRRLR